MADAHVLVTRFVRATNRADARRQIAEEPWVYAFPDGSPTPGKVIPLRSQYDKLTLIHHEIVGVIPFVQETGDALAGRTLFPYLVTSLLHFQHPSKQALDMLIRMGTWISVETSASTVFAYSEPAKPGAFDEFIQE